MGGATPVPRDPSPWCTRVEIFSWLTAVFWVLALLPLVSSAEAATASWSLEPASYDFGVREPGTGPSAPAVFTLTNTGETQLPEPMAFLSNEPGTEPRAFETTADECRRIAALPPGAQCTVDVVFDPLYPGPVRGSISFVDPSSQVAPASAGLSGVGAGPIVSFWPPAAHVGSWLVGEGPSVPTVLTLTNSGNRDLMISAIALVNMEHKDASQFAVAGGSCHAGGTVAPGSTCTVWLTVSPTTPGFLYGDLKISDNAKGGYQLVQVNGIGITVKTDSPPLATYISHRPPGRVHRRFVVFSFGVAGGHVRFECRLDQRPYRRCSSPKRYGHLSLGGHVFMVRAHGHPAGVSPAPAVAHFAVIPANARRRG